MPRILFYAGTAFFLFLALSAATDAVQQLQGGDIAFVAVQGASVSTSTTAAWAIVVALLAGVACAALLVRMAALLAARNLFGAFLALFSVGGAVTSLVWLLFLQTRMLMQARHGAAAGAAGELHFAACMMLGYFVSISLLALRPYFHIQASRVLSALVFFPLPLFLLIVTQELFVGSTSAALPARSPASLVFFGVLAMLFFAIAVHCIRHRHMFLELTNLRELLDARIDPASRPTGGRPVRIAFDS
ncbi:MAG TPA: hypothetical protein VJ032_05330 [Thermoanaerobaculia bacterium]|nr:hypothetical protein [Thermoanaerobaculia bacterium]